MTQAGISEDHMIVPYFFRYKCQSHCLCEHASQLRKRGLEATDILQQDDAPAHYGHPVRE